MVSQLKLDIILQIYDIMTKRVRCISKCKNAHLSTDFLTANEIYVSHLEWHPDTTVDLEPRFCDPYPANDFEKLFERTKATGYRGSDAGYTKWNSREYEECGASQSAQEMAKSEAASTYVKCLLGRPHVSEEIAAEGDWLPCIGTKLYTSRSSCSEDHPPSEWYSRTFWRSLPWPQDDLPKDPIAVKKLDEILNSTCLADWPIAVTPELRRVGKKSSVHMAVTSFDDSEICDERILRSEMIVAISIMRDQMRQKPSQKQHVIFPVFVYSWSGFHVRVVQVHFDPFTSRIIVRKTSYIRIDGPEREDEIKLLLRWMMNKPRGRTRWEDFKADKDAVVAVQPSADEACSQGKQSIECC